MNSAGCADVCIAGVVDMTDCNGIDGAGRGHVILYERELAAVISDVAGTGAINAVGLVAVVAFKTDAVAVFNYEIWPGVIVFGIAAAEAHIGTV
jgi:hypothetical protein